MFIKKFLYIFALVSLLISTLFSPAFAESTFVSDLEIKQENLPSYFEFEERKSSMTQNESAMLFIGSEKNSFSLNDKMRLSVIVDPKKQSINLVSAIIQYPKDKLELLEIDNSDSNFSIFLEKDANEKEGIIRLSYIQPFPGINKKANIANLVFNPLKTGEIKIEFLDDSMVLANDGFGTNVLKEVITFYSTVRLF